MMRIDPIKKFFLFTILAVLLAWLPLFSQNEDRYFDTAEPVSKEVRLAIFYPSLGSIRALVELRKNGLINVENLLVIGVFHEKERTDYKASIAYVKDNNLDWVKFHELRAELNGNNLFKKNPLTTEFEEIFKKSDGVIFFGGADIPPQIFKKKTNLLTRIETPYRNFLELSFIFHLLGGFQDNNFKALVDSSPQFPVLAFCLGCQSLNVGTGGTLIQDIWSEVYGKKYFEDVIALGKENWHSNPFASLYPEEKLIGYYLHRIKFIKNSKFRGEFDMNKEDTPYILSSHHQMAGKLGKGMKIAATSLDGKVVEAIEHEKFPNVLGVQFHPEFPGLYDPEKKFRFTPEDKEGKSLLSILEANPPSLAFHKKIWSWFSGKLEEYHRSKPKF
jgi:putative glutamine amidotransferase